MKILRNILFFAVITLVTVLASCDFVNNNNAGSQQDVIKSIDHTCPSQGCSTTHFCLYLRDNDEDDESLMIYYLTLEVTVEGKDCNNNDYYCYYSDLDGGITQPTNDGSNLPWYNTNCSYTRYVRITTTGGVYTGNHTFSYPLSEPAVCFLEFNAY